MTAEAGSGPAGDAVSGPDGDLSGGPLTGVRVVEISAGRAGRIAGMLLADLGADVVTAVAPGPLARTGRPAERGRAAAPPEPADVCWDRGKRQIEVPDADALQLAAGADVLLVSETPARIWARGLTSQRLRGVAPDVVHVWLPPYGEHGEWCDLPDDPLLLAALTSLAVHMPADDESPVAPVVSAISSIHGALGAAAAVAGLVGRSRSGRAQPAVVTGLHAGGTLMGTAFTEVNDAPAFAPSRAIVPAPNWRTYACADGKRVFMAALTPDLFFRALEAVGRLDIMALPEVAGDFQAILDLRRGRRAVAAVLEPEFAARTSEEWIARFGQFRVPCARVQTRAEWFAGPVVAANGARVELRHPELGVVAMPGVPIGFSRTPGQVRGFARPAEPGKAPWSGVVPGAGAPGAPAAADTAPAGRAAALPLSGLRVLDVSSFLAAPLATTVLADFGANVIRAERPGGDSYRTYPLSFLAVNQRKRGIILNLGDAASAGTVHAILDGMDVLMENVRPAARARLGLDGTATRHPRLVHCSMSAFGDAGEWADLPGFDPILQSLNGMARAQGGDGDPVTSSAGVNDAATGTLSALGILAALYWRERTGLGQRVRTSLAAGSTFVQAAEYTTWDGAPEPPHGGELFRGPADGHRYYECADGWIATAATDSSGRAALLGALDAGNFAGAERALRARPTAAAIGLLNRHGVPACRVVARPRPLRDPFLEANGYSHLVDTPHGTGRVVDRHSRWPDAPAARQSRYFEAGADTEAVFGEYGISLP